MHWLLVTGYIKLVIFLFRLFSCGTSKDGESHIVEWNESEGAVKRTYQGFRKRSLGVVQFDTTKNRFLAAGDDFSVKFWDMDNTQLLTSSDADGGLPVSILLNIMNIAYKYDYSLRLEFFFRLIERRVHASASIKMVPCWLFLPMTMESKF